MAAAAELGQGWGATCEGAVGGALKPLKAETPLRLAELTVAATYDHGFDTSTNTGGSIGVAIGPATVNLNRAETRNERGSGTLALTARYERREEVPTVTETKADA